MRTIGDLIHNLTPEGDYKVRLSEVKLTTARSSGNPKFEFYAEILNGDRKGRTLVWSRSLMDNAIWKLGEDLIKLNVGFDENTELPDDPDAVGKMLLPVLSKATNKVYEISVSHVKSKTSDRKFEEVTLAEAQSDAQQAYDRV